MSNNFSQQTAAFNTNPPYAPPVSAATVGSDRGGSNGAQQAAQSIPLTGRRTMLFGLGQQGRQVLELLERQIRERWGLMLPNIALVVLEDKNTLQPWLDGLLNEGGSRKNSFIPLALDIPSLEDVPTFQKHVAEWLPVQIKFQQRKGVSKDQAYVTAPISEGDASLNAPYHIPEEPESTEEDANYTEDMTELSEAEVNQIRLDRKSARWRGRLALLGGNLREPTYRKLKQVMNDAFKQVSNGQNTSVLARLGISDVPQQYDAYVVASLDDPVVSGMLLDFAYLLNFYFQPGSIAPESNHLRSSIGDKDFERTREMGGGFLTVSEFFTPRAVIIMPDFLRLNSNEQAKNRNLVQAVLEANAAVLENYRGDDEENEADVQERAEASAYAFFRELDYYMDSRYNNVQYELTYTTRVNSTVIVRGLPPFQACYLIERGSDLYTVSQQDVNYVVSTWLGQMTIGPLHGYFLKGEYQGYQRPYQRLPAYSSLGLASYSLPFRPVADYLGLDLAVNLLQNINKTPPATVSEQSPQQAQAFINQTGLNLNDLLSTGGLAPGRTLNDKTYQLLQIDPGEFVTNSVFDPQALADRLDETITERTGSVVLRGGFKKIEEAYKARSKQVAANLQHEFEERLDGGRENNNSAVLARTDIFLSSLQERIERLRVEAHSRLQPLEGSIASHLQRANYHRAQLYQLANVFWPKGAVWLLISGLMLAVMTVFVGSGLFLTGGFNSKSAAGVKNTNILLVTLGIAFMLLMLGLMGYCIWEVYNRLKQAKQKVIDEYQLALEEIYTRSMLEYSQKLYDEVSSEAQRQKEVLRFFTGQLQAEIIRVKDKREAGATLHGVESSASSLLRMDIPIMDVPRTRSLIEEFLGLQPGANEAALNNAYSVQLSQFYKRRKLSEWCNAMLQPYANVASETKNFGEAIAVFCTDQMFDAAKALRLENQLQEEVVEGPPGSGYRRVPKSLSKRREDLEELLKLSRPLWRTNAKDLVPPSPAIDCYVAVENTDASQTVQLLRDDGIAMVDFSTGDRHRLTVVHKQVGVPLFALTQLQQLRRSYDAFKGGARLRYLHTSRSHIVLPDLIPLDATDGTENREWLEKDVQLLFAVGRVFGSIQYGLNQAKNQMMYYYMYEDALEVKLATNRKAVRPKERWLRTTRAESAALLIDRLDWRAEVLRKLNKLDLLKNSAKLRDQVRTIKTYLEERYNDCDDWELIKLRLYLDTISNQL